MRIRSIMPDFWRSEDVGSWDWATRLFFIGLWSYVDDNGVGRDSPALIASDLFPYDMERDPKGTLETVNRCLDTLSAEPRVVVANDSRTTRESDATVSEGSLSHPESQSQVARFAIDGRRFLFIVKWDRYQRVDKPGVQRYPRPTWADAFPPERPARRSRQSRETPSSVSCLEKGRRGEVTTTRSSAATVADATETTTHKRPKRVAPNPHEARFDEFWSAYPKRKDRAKAEQAWAKATADTDPDVILAGLAAQGPLVGAREFQFVPYPSTWLNKRRWEDETAEPPPVPAGPSRRKVDANGQELPEAWW